MSPCLIVLAIFCLPVENTEIEVDSGPFAGVARFDRGDVHHSVYFWTDDLGDYMGLDQELCIDGQCIDYKTRSLEGRAGEERRLLFLTVRRQGDAAGVFQITLDAETDEQIDAALGSIRIRRSDGSAGLALSELR